MKLRIADCGLRIRIPAAIVALFIGAPAPTNPQSAIRNPQSVVLDGGTLWDGTGAPAVRDATVVIEGRRIVRAGTRSRTKLPAGARLINTTGRTILPGFVDLHFHYSPHSNVALPVRFLLNGVTTVRDMGNWIEHNREAFDRIRAAGLPAPRLLMSGPHLDGTDPAYPNDAIVVLDSMEAERVTRELIDKGATSIKVYFRLPLERMKSVIETAHARGVHVTGHLEIVDIREAAKIGLDGIEHATSVGVALLSPPDAERYRQGVLKSNEYRRKGRYEVWERVDLGSPQAQELIRLLVSRGVYLSPTIAIFELSRKNVGPEQPLSVRNMAAFAVAYRKAGGRLVVGSHGSVPNAEEGFAYQRELETYVEAGLTPADALIAATRAGAEALRLNDIGTIEPGKVADVIVIAGDPLANISDTRKVELVIRDGEVVDREQVLARIGTLKK